MFIRYKPRCLAWHTGCFKNIYWINSFLQSWHLQHSLPCLPTLHFDLHTCWIISNTQHHVLFLDSTTLGILFLSPHQFARKFTLIFKNFFVHHFDSEVYQDTFLSYHILPTFFILSLFLVHIFITHIINIVNIPFHV